ncbi:MAG: hypothetical protein ACLQU1_43720 [Bryobacteraceae bacterium]
MIEGSGKGASLPRNTPIADGLIDQEMKEGIICGGHRAPQAGLFWIRWLPVRQMVGLLQEIVSKRHSLGPRRISALGLLGFASEVEMREHSQFRKIQPFFHPINHLAYYSPDIPFVGGFVGQENAEENRPIAAPVLIDVVTDPHHVRRQQFDDLRDDRIDLRLLPDFGGQIGSTHALSIPHPLKGTRHSRHSPAIMIAVRARMAGATAVGFTFPIEERRDAIEPGVGSRTKSGDLTIRGWKCLRRSSMAQGGGAEIGKKAAHLPGVLRARWAPPARLLPA